MPVIRSTDATHYETHGSTFHSYVAPTRGSRELCAWRLEVPTGSVGVEHVVTREEVLVVLSGSLVVHLDGDVATVETGDVVLVPSGCRLSLDNPGGPASAWVTTSVGLTARMVDGTVLTPAWAS
jgi:mannose-6-phosphate isomerase-like protein (cupin superfamily)